MLHLLNQELLQVDQQRAELESTNGLIMNIEAGMDAGEAGTKEVVDAVNMQLMRNSDSRMPISNTSRSQVTTGRRPSFQD